MEIILIKIYYSLNLWGWIKEFIIVITPIATIIAILYVGSFDKRRRSEDGIKKHKITLLEERDRIKRFNHKFNENSDIIGNLIKKLHVFISTPTVMNDTNPIFLRLTKYPSKCNYDQYVSIHLQNESLVKDFDETITTTTKHDNMVEYIIRLIKDHPEYMRSLKYVKEQCELFVDDITLHQKNYKNLSDTIENHIKESTKIDNEKRLKFIPRSPRWKIKQIRNIEIIKHSEPSK